MEVCAPEIDDPLAITFNGLKSSSGGALSPTFVCVGDIIETDAEEGFLKGHGTQIVEEQLVATICGVLERINKLVSVRPLKSRYAAETGDVVVGRVSAIHRRNWKIDLNGRVDAQLGLSAVILPGGILRRRTVEDELNMRSVFREGDLISAEVQTVRHDGGINLHTRSEKYGQLQGGQLVQVAANLIHRQRHHFHTLDDLGVTLIFGCNGMVWIAPTGKAEIENRRNICRLANAVKCLSKLCLPIFLATVMNVFKLSEENAVVIRDMSRSDFLAQIVEKEAERRQDMVA
ncbi:hypothetical protein BSKO_14065 [Bryopsis sp. KO-2023]|nr:hypothetical protein BSKO_14065 [Bryopsis sp. KO-2023]